MVKQIISKRQTKDVTIDQVLKPKIQKEGIYF